MQSSFGIPQFGTTGFEQEGSGKRIALLGDPSSHGGSLVSTNQDGTLVVMIGDIGISVDFGSTFGMFGYGDTSLTEDMPERIPVCVEGCSHTCPIIGHGTTSVTAITIKSFHNGKLIVTYGAIAGCGAKITPSDRKVYVE